MLKEFREFAMRGNVMDMAIGIIIGGAFGKIISSLVNDVLMPPIGMLVGGMDFTKLGITLRAAEGDAAAVMLKYGMFIQQVVDFVIIALVIFMMVKAMNSLRKKEEAAPAAPAPPPRQEALLEEIRDLLKKK